MSFLVVSVFLFLFPFPFTFLCLIISEKMNEGSAGAAIPGGLVGLASFAVCWLTLAGMVLHRALW